MKKYKFDVSNVESFVNDVRLNFTSDDLEEIQKVGKELNHCLNSMGQVGEVIVVKASDENPIGKTIVVMNESHGLMDEQKSILDRKYPNYEILSVPASGWTLQEIAWHDNMFIEIRSQIDNLEKTLYPEPTFNSL